MTRSVAAALAGAAGLAALSGVVYGGHAAWLTLALLAPLGAATAVAAHVLVDRRARLGDLRRQGAALGALVALVLGAGVALFVAAMFVSAHDAFFTAVLVADALLLGLGAARLLGRRAVADYEALVARVGEEESARRALVAAVSHDLRTPITALRLLTDAVEDGIGDPQAYAARMSTHVRALGALIDDLFELSRLESGELRWTMRQVALSELVREAVEAMRPEAAASSVVVRAVLDDDASEPLASGDPARLQRVLLNVIQNAIRHTPADGSVTVRTRASVDAVEIEVADTGSGIAPSERERVFDAFHRGDRARHDGGSGLGLAISRAIVEAHGGRIWIADADAGTSVRIALPSPGGPRAAPAARG